MAPKWMDGNSILWTVIAVSPASTKSLFLTTNFFKIRLAPKPLRDILIFVMKNITFQTDTYALPFRLTCTVSGLTKVYTSIDYINGKLHRFGGLKNLLEKYVCRDAKRLLKAGKTPEEVKQILNPTAKEEAPVIHLFADLLTKHTTPLALPAPMPVAKADKNGKLRNAKGHLIKKGTEHEYRIAA
jgi:hypothetical protein